MIIETKGMLIDENGEKQLSNFTLWELIQQKDVTKYLGVQIDTQLKWKDHISQVSSEFILSVLFNRVSSMTGRTIRNVDINLRPLRLNTTIAQNCYVHRRALLWNNLPKKIKLA